MNGKLLASSLIFGFCLLFVNNWSPKLGSIASAQNFIAQESEITGRLRGIQAADIGSRPRISKFALTPTKYQNLSQPEKANLQQGKVILKGQKGKYLALVLATGDLNTAWSVLTDYNNFAQFLPNIASSKIVLEDGDRVVFEQINVVDLWLFQQEFEVQIEAFKTKPAQVDFKIVDGDLKKLIGRWQLEEVSPGSILVSHAVEVEPGSDTEKPFFYGVYESSLEETLQAIALEINKRS